MTYSYIIFALSSNARKRFISFGDSINRFLEFSFLKGIKKIAISIKIFRPNRETPSLAFKTGFTAIMHSCRQKQYPDKLFS